MSSAEYSDLHRKFLRRLTAKGCLSLGEAQGYFDELKNETPDRSNLQLEEVIQRINTALKLFEQQVSTIRHEQFGEEFLVFSTVAPIPTLIAKQKLMRPNDFKYFEAVLRAVLEKEDFTLREKAALILEPDGRSKTLARENERLLEMWVRLGYFSLKEGRLYLGAKSLVEFKGYIHSEFPAIKTCQVCYTLTFMNNSCPGCNNSFHEHCLNRFWRSMANACPSCRRPWRQDE